MRPSSLPGGVIIAGVILSLMGGMFLVAVVRIALPFVSGAAQLLGAERVPMTILSNTVSVIDFPAESRRDVSETYHRPIVTYAYTVDGTAYAGEQLSPFDSQAGPRWARAISARYQVGQTYLGYYRPEQPAMAFLSWTLHPAPLFLGGFVASLALLLLYPVGHMLRTVRTAHRAAQPAAPSEIGGTRQERRQRARAAAGPRQRWIDLRQYSLVLPNRVLWRLYALGGSCFLLMAISLENWCLSAAALPFVGVGGLFFRWVAKHDPHG